MERVSTGVLALAVCAGVFCAAVGSGPDQHGYSAGNRPKNAIVAPGRGGASARHGGSARLAGGTLHASGQGPRLVAKGIGLPVMFEPNEGQAPQGVEYLGRATGLDVALTSDGVDVRVPDDRHSGDAMNRLRIRLRGRSGIMWRGEEPQAGESNYFIGNDPKKWHTRVRHFARTETDNARGLGLAVYGGREGLEYDVRLSPGMATSKMRIELTGARDVKLGRDGALSMRVGSRKMRMNAPLIYEDGAAEGPERAAVDPALGNRGDRANATLILAAERTSQRVRSKRASGAKSSRQGKGRSASGAHYSAGHARGARATPRRSQSTPENAERRRLRKSMHHDQPTPHPRRRRKATPLGLPPTGAKADAGRRTTREASRHNVRGGYVLEADGSIGIWAAPHDPSKTLVIDPSISVTYDSFLGGAGADQVIGLAEDAAGNVYFAGTTTSAQSFPEGANAVFQTERGSSQLFIGKIAFSGSGVGALQYVSFFGGSAAQWGGQVAVDASGNAAVLGTTTSTDYPVTDGSAPSTGLTGGSGNDAVVSEVDATGENLLFSTLFGGSGAESHNASSGIPLNGSENIPAAQGGIAFDALGNIYVASDTTSRDLPTTAGSFQPAFGGQSRWDGFLAEFQPYAAALYPADILYCSYLGTNSESAVAIGGVAADAASPANVYIAGTTTNQFNGFPVKGAFQSGHGGGASDGFLMAITPDGSGQSDLLYATLLGGAGMDEALALAVDRSTPPIAYVAGATQSATFAPDAPVIAGPSTKLYQPLGGHPAAQNAFLATVAWNPATQTTSLNYFTYFGGSQAEAAEAVMPVSQQALYVAGTATSWDFGWHDNIQAFNGTSDAFVAKVNPSVGGTFTTAGTPVNAMGNALAADLQGHVYLAGATTASDFPTALTSNSSINGFQLVCASCQSSNPQPDGTIVAMKENAAQHPSIAFDHGSLSFGTGGIPVGTPANPAEFAIYNLGESPLHITGTSVAGSNAADFSVSLSGNCLPAIPAGGNCVATGNFTPSAAGLEAAIVNFSDDAPGSPQYLEITGSGGGPLSIAPTSFAFGDVSVNTNLIKIVTFTAPTLPVQLSNFTGPDSANFVRVFATNGPVQDCQYFGYSLVSGGSCSIAYQFSPTTAGNLLAEITFTYQLSGQTSGTLQALSLTGTGIMTGSLANVRPSTVTFAQQTAGTTSPPQTVFVVNTGNAPMVFTQSPQISGQNAAEFSQTSQCGVSLAVASQCTISVQFSPQSTGAKAATLVVADNASGSPQTVALIGTGLPAPASQAQVVPTSWNFASQSLGSGTQENITITNTGQALLSFTQAISISGPNFQDFSETTNCPSQGGLGVGASCTVAVTFEPVESGNLTATLNIANNASGSPQSVPLSGVGQQANASITPSSPLVFRGQQPGSSSAPQNLTVASIGPGQPLRVTAVSLIGANAGDFTEKDNCVGAAITASLPCTIQVMFSPACKTGAARNATLQIQDNGATPSETISVSGTATGDFCASVSPSGSTMSVKAGTIANFLPISLVSVTSFSGTVSLTCASAPTGPTCNTLPAATIPVGPTTAAQFEVQVLTATSSTSSIMGWTKQLPGATTLVLTGAIIVFLWPLWSSGRRTSRLARTAAVLTLLTVGFSACGGGSSDPPAATDPPLGVGSYSLTVTATDGTESLPINLTLNVTQ